MLFPTSDNKINICCFSHPTLSSELLLPAPVCSRSYPWNPSCRLRPQMKKELEWTWSWGSWGGSMVRTCRVEHLAAGCSSSEQFPFIHFINTSSSVTSSWLENTHTHTHTHARTHAHTHAISSPTMPSSQRHTRTLPESCSTSSVLRKPSCFAASDCHPPAPPFKFITNYSSSRKKKKKMEKRPLSPRPHGNRSPLFLLCTINQTTTV